MIHCPECDFTGSAAEYVAHRDGCIPVLCTVCKGYMTFAELIRHDCSDTSMPQFHNPGGVEEAIKPQGQGEEEVGVRIIPENIIEMRPFSVEDYTPPFISMILILLDGILGYLKDYIQFLNSIEGDCLSLLLLSFSIYWMHRRTDKLLLTKPSTRFQVVCFILISQSAKFSWASTFAAACMPFGSRIHSFVNRFGINVPAIPAFFILTACFMLYYDVKEAVEIVWKAPLPLPPRDPAPAKAPEMPRESAIIPRRRSN